MDSFFYLNPLIVKSDFRFDIGPFNSPPPHLFTPCLFNSLGKSLLDLENGYPPFFFTSIIFYLHWRAGFGTVVYIF